MLPIEIYHPKRSPSRRINGNFQKMLDFFMNPCIMVFARGSLVKRLRRCPLTAESPVRFRYELLLKRLPGCGEPFLTHRYAEGVSLGRCFLRGSRKPVLIRFSGFLYARKNESAKISRMKKPDFICIPGKRPGKMRQSAKAPDQLQNTAIIR